MDIFLVEVSLEVIGRDLFYSVDGDGEVFGIRPVKTRYEVVFTDNRVVSFPASQVIVVYKEVTEEEYVASMEALYPVNHA